MPPPQGSPSEALEEHPSSNSQVWERFRTWARPWTIGLVGLLTAVSSGIGAPNRGQNRANPGRSPELLDLQGKPVQILRSGKSSPKFFVFIFTRTDCPISNVYAPEVSALQTQFGSQGVEFWLVYGTDEKPAKVRKHLTDFVYRCGAVYDPDHRFAKKSRVKVTPEAAVYGRAGELLYHGRIDDRYVALGAARSAPENRDLQTALKQLIAGKPAKSPSKPAVGCLIE
jgi:hypothetical protein